jgi:2-methylisocitrate lyase-like PEP mutase family enzyme
MPTLAEKAAAFRALHQQPAAFIIPNPWDIGSAQVLAALGFKALATTSAGFAFSVGRRDNRVSREATLAHLRDLASATALPVSADLGPCFGDDPEAVSETIRLAGATGIVGGSVEDSTGNPALPMYDKVLAIERVRAAVASARRLPFPFTLTARCENYLTGRKDLADTIDRLQRYEEAGADVLYAPALTSREDITAVVKAVGKPVNVLAGMGGLTLNAAELSEIGVKRISVGSALARASLGALVRAAEEMRDKGTFAFAKDALNSKDANGFFAP